jgi:hypothetical protein
MRACSAPIAQSVILQKIGMRPIADLIRQLQMKAEAASITAVPPVVIVIRRTFTVLPAVPVTIAIIQVMEAVATISFRKSAAPRLIDGGLLFNNDQSTSRSVNLYCYKLPESLDVLFAHCDYFPRS